ncbi:hypothetical protein AB0I02_02165 [Streptomyces phaeochromogenes]
MGNEKKARRMYQHAVEYLCRNADELRELIGPVQWDVPFTRVRDRDSADPEWREAVRALHDAAVAAGIPNGLGLLALRGVVDWPSRPVPRAAGWVCPTGCCSRVDLCDGEAPQTPLCALTEQPMRLVDG